jgi:hypothetical protein
MHLNNEITIRNIREVFFQMEVAENLFSLQMKDDTYYWDIVRRDIFLSLHTIHGGLFVEPEALQAPSLLTKMRDLVKLVINSFTLRYLTNKAPKYIFITGQRIRQGSCLIDNISDHLYDLVSADAVAIELMNKAVISYRKMFFGRKTRIPPVAVRRSHYDKEITQIAETIEGLVRKYFVVSIDAHRLIEEPILAFRENRNYYRQLFTKFRPKVILCINNGTLTGMFSAAKEMKVPTIELQHGGSSPGTIFYSYPQSIAVSHPGLSLPTAYLIYSDFWSSNTHFPVSYFCPIGSDYFYQEPIAGDDDGVVIISSYMYRDSLLSLAVELADLNKGKKIYFKLHPHEFNKKEAVVAACGGKKNIVVVCDEMDFPELFKLCNYVVGIHSTTIYIALQARKKVCIFKRDNYFWHEAVFDYVELFDSANELHSILHNYDDLYFKNLSKVPVFFQPFDADRFIYALSVVGRCI